VKDAKDELGHDASAAVGRRVDTPPQYAASVAARGGAGRRISALQQRVFTGT
jgi:hypothetical protein